MKPLISRNYLSPVKCELLSGVLQQGLWNTGRKDSDRWILTCTSGMGLVRKEMAKTTMRVITKRMMAKYR